MPDPADSLLGALLGGALGDALGRPTEFDERPNAGLRDDADIDLPRPALVTDDTQMALAVARAMLDDGPLVARLIRRFAQWEAADHHGGRAPGGTCLRASRALGRLDDPASWPTATLVDSKGCGGVMRQHPASLLTAPGDPAPVLQSALTHGHPLACTAALTWDALVRAAAAGVAPADWPAAAHAGLDAPMPAVLEPLVPSRSWRQLPWPEAVAEMRAALDAVQVALDGWDGTADPCALTGAGWVAEEAVATSLLVAVRYADDPCRALRRGARTCGDSDSIAAMAGVLIGAWAGARAWPQDWVDAIEEPYRTEILDLAR